MLSQRVRRVYLVLDGHVFAGDVVYVRRGLRDENALGHALAVRKAQDAHPLPVADTDIGNDGDAAMS